MKIGLPIALLVLVAAPSLFGDPTPLINGDSISCFNRMEGAGTLTMVDVAGMPFAKAIHIKTGAVSATANAWDIRPRCFDTLAANQNDTVAATFWMRTVSAPANNGVTSFVVEQTVSPFVKSVSLTAVANSDWKKFDVPFLMAQTYSPGGFNLSFWVTYPNQEIEIGGFSILDYGPNVPFSNLGLTTWPYDGHDADAAWRADAAARIEQYRKGDVVVVARDAAGNPVANAPVHLRMKRHAFGFGTAIAGDALQVASSDGDHYRQAVNRLFNKVVMENALKWPFFETWGRAQDDFMFQWFAANNFQMVRGHNVIWPGIANLPNDVQKLLQANPVDQDALRKRINDHIAQVMAYTKGKVTEWDVLNEPYTNKDVQAVLGSTEMALWFQQARQADPNIKLYINDYNNVDAGGYDLPHINAYQSIISDILAHGGPIDGIGLQSHFDSNLTPPVRVFELLDQFASFGKDLQVTEFDVNVRDEQLQADYTRDFLTICFSHPSMKGFMIWGFWEGAHWRPPAAMIRKDWSPKLNYAVWNDLLFNQWWTDVQGATEADGAFRSRGFLGDYDVDITVNGNLITVPLTVASNLQPAYASSGALPSPVIAKVVNAASFQEGPIAPGELIAISGTGFGPSALSSAAYDANGRLPTSTGDTRVLFDGIAAPMISSVAGQVSAVVPYGVGNPSLVQVEYQGIASPSQSVTVASAAPGIFRCGNKPGVASVINVSAGNKSSCNDDFVQPGPGDVVTVSVTGEGLVAPRIQDGQMPAIPPPAPVQPWTVTFGGIEARTCAATSIGLLSPGLTQISVCVPDGVPRTNGVELAFQVGGVPSPKGVAIDLQPSWKVVWSDEFNGPAGASVDPAKWGFDTGGGGWGNQELETYTNSTENVFQDGNGNLVIRAIKTSANSYTSGRLKTQGKFAIQFGKIEARIKVPFGQGMWPAFWMLGADIVQAGWPTCGEIDIMENIGKEPATIHGTIHGPGYSGGNGIGGPFALPAGGRLEDDFHVYGIEWSETSLAFFVDGAKYFEATPASLPAGKTWVYQHPFFLLLNVAVGGGWPGNPDATTNFPQQMLVDWVRVSQKK